MRALILATTIWLAQVLYPGPIVKPPSIPSTNFLPTHHFKPEQVLPTLRLYHDAMRLYRQGRDGEARAIVSILPRPQVEFIMETLRTTRHGKAVRLSENATTPLAASTQPDDAPFNWTRLDLAAAGMLHGDIALSKVDRQGFEAELRLALTMLTIADLPEAQTTEQPGTWTHDWLLAVGNAMLTTMTDDSLVTLLTYADLFFKDDGPLLLVRGTLDEAQSEAAGPSFFAATAADAPASTRAGRDALRKDGIEALTQAVKVMPDSSEVAVRLAHLHLDMHQPDRAAPLLDRVLASDTGDWWYFAALMRGEVYEGAGDAAAAERLYRQLIARFPGAQSPYLALGMLQYAGGRRDEAVTTFDAMYGRPPAGDDGDPWWKYSTRMGAPASAAYKRMRQALQQ